jgi:hypothetical protein
VKEKEAVIKERDELITDRNKAIKTSAVLLWMIEARDDDDDVNDANDADNKQTVPSSTTAQTYVIAYDNIKECYTCSCPDYMYRRASKDELCKHITKLKSTGRLPIQPDNPEDASVAKQAALLKKIDKERLEWMKNDPSGLGITLVPSGNPLTNIARREIPVGTYSKSSANPTQILLNGDKFDFDSLEAGFYLRSSSLRYLHIQMMPGWIRGLTANKKNTIGREGEKTITVNFVYTAPMPNRNSPIQPVK